MEVLQRAARRTVRVTHRRRTLTYHRRKAVNTLVLATGDALGFLLAVLFAGVLRSWIYGAPLVPSWIWMVLVGWWVMASTARLLPSWGMGIVEELRRIIIVLCLIYAGAAVVLFLTKQPTIASRFTLSVAFACSILLVPTFRTFSKRFLLHIGEWGLPAVVYGGGGTTAQVINALREEPGLGYMPVGVFEDDPELWGDYIEGVPVRGSTAQQSSEAPVAILAVPDIPREQVAELLEGPLAHYRHVVIIPDLIEIPTLWVRSRNVAGFLGLEINCNLQDPLSQSLKRGLDLCAVLLFLPVWLPLCGLIAFAISIQDGESPLFLQRRVGRHGRRFTAFKFRTMVPDAERILLHNLREDPALRIEWETNRKLRNDPRITRLGSFLRKSSLDELPQLFNVLRGEMSLVGPRPLPAYHHDELPPRIRQLRTRVRPGMTGLWQVSGRSDAGNEGIERWDSFYVRNWSVWLDLVILVRTVRVVLRGSGAY